MQSKTISSADAPTNINGDTEFVWIVGDPVSQVKAPQTMNPHYLAAADNLQVIPVLVSSHSLRAVFQAAKSIGNLRGWIVTVPHKIVLAGWVDELSTAARVAGAVNVIRFQNGRSQGDLLDGIGFVTSLVGRGFGVPACSAIILGAGGVGSAIALALAEAGAARLAIHDPERSRVTSLIDRLKRHGPPGTSYDIGDPATAATFDLLVNASPVGMSGDGRSPIDSAFLRAGMAVAEVVMTPEFTPLLLAARNCGCEIHPGKQVLSGQLPQLLDFFR